MSKVGKWESGKPHLKVRLVITGITSPEKSSIFSKKSRLKIWLIHQKFVPLYRC